MAATSYHPPEVPLDNEGFVRSFAVQSDSDIIEAQSFFEEFGFVVFSGILSPTEQVNSINDMWGVVEGFCGGKLGINRNDPSTWRKRWPGGGPGFLGEATTPQAWRNRVNPHLRKGFEVILGTTELVSSLDNFGMLRPTKKVPMYTLPPQHPCRTNVDIDMKHVTDASGHGGLKNKTESEVAVEDVDEWVTESKWLHWDMNPFRWVDETMPPYTFSEFGWISENNGAPRGSANAKVQGLLNFIDARVEDGGFLCVPGFHKHLKEWCYLPQQDKERKSSVDDTQCDYFDVPSGDPLEEHAQRIPMRAGSLLIWNSELPHCNYPNTSSRFRMVQYVKCFPLPKLQLDPSSCASSAMETTTDFTPSSSVGLGEEVPISAGGGGGGGKIVLSHEQKLMISLQKRRTAALQAMQRSELSEEEIECFDDNQRAMLFLCDYQY